MGRIHETALVDEAAELADDVEVGAFSIIGPLVKIGPGSRIGPHVVVTGRTTIGSNTRIFQFCSIGEEPQDKKYDGEDTELIIGVRELCQEGEAAMYRWGFGGAFNDSKRKLCSVLCLACRRAGNRTIRAELCGSSWRRVASTDSSAA